MTFAFPSTYYLFYGVLPVRVSCEMCLKMSLFANSPMMMRGQNPYGAIFNNQQQESHLSVTYTYKISYNISPNLYAYSDVWDLCRKD
jgi:hypothetical protein